MRDLTDSASDRNRRGYLWILLLVVAVIHVPSLFHAFFLDDYVYLDKVRDLHWQGALNILRSATMDQSASGVWWVPVGTLPFYRPIGQLTFAADHALWGLQPFGYHLTNLLLHLVCTVLTWRLARRLFEVPAHALAATVVFALHPVHIEAVTWISGRFDLLVCACVLASVLSYLKWRDGSGFGWAALSVLWFLLGLGCKETALILPVVLAGIELFSRQARPGRAGQRIAIVAVFAIISLLYVAGRIALFGSLTGKLPPPYGLDKSSPLAALKDLGWNLALYVLDLGLFVHVEPVYLSQFWRDTPLLFGPLLAISALLLVAAGIIGRSRVSRIGLGWLVIFAAPSLLSMPGERNIYLASVGLAVFVGAAFLALDSRPGPAPSRDDSTSATPWLRPASYAVIALWLVICLAQQGLMGRLAAAGDKVYRDLQAMLPDPPPNARIYVANQCPLNSVGFAQAIRLRYNRSDLSGCALSLSPTLGASSTDKVVPLGPDSIRLIRKGGFFFGSFVERFHRFADPPSTLADAGLRAGLRLLDPPATYDGLTTMEFGLPYPLSDPRLQIFYWDNHLVRTRLDLLWIGSMAELKPCNPAALDAARISQNSRPGL